VKNRAKNSDTIVFDFASVWHTCAIPLDRLELVDFWSFYLTDFSLLQLACGWEGLEFFGV
jgi:hypothetical protein